MWVRCLETYWPWICKMDYFAGNTALKTGSENLHQVLEMGWFMLGISRELCMQWMLVMALDFGHLRQTVKSNPPPSLLMTEC